MKKKLLHLPLIMLLALTSCGENNPTTASETTASETTTVEETSIQSGNKESEYVLSGVSQNVHYAEYLRNKAVPASNAEGFFDNEEELVVGSDNVFQFKPSLSVSLVTFNGDIPNTPVEASESDWTKPFDVKVEYEEEDKYVEADNTYYDSLDNVNCSIDFSTKAIGKTIRLTITPTGVSETKAASFQKTMEFEVEEGYNIYTEAELSLMDDTGAWDSIQESAQIKGKVAKKFYLQTNLTYSGENIPTTKMYTKEECEELGISNDYVGTFKDNNQTDNYVDGSVIRHEGNDDLVLNGNYFQLDFSEIPLITRFADKVSTSQFFYITNGNFFMENVNVTGNAKNATNDEDEKFRGGLIFVKAGGASESITAENMITRQCMITFMSETNENKGYIEFDIDQAKCTDNYNSFIYNYGGKIVAKDSLFEGCGGPIIIQDHTDVPDGEKGGEFDTTTNQWTVRGHKPSVTFEDCTLNNYVAGSEAWFSTFEGATALAAQIKAMSDLFATLGLSYLIDSETKKATISTMGDGAKMFNFVVFNKSGSAQGLTNSEILGEVNILHSEETRKDDKFNYNEPTTADYIAYATDPTSAAAQNVIKYSTLRTLNGQGAPVFQVGSNFYYYDGTHTYLQPFANATAGETDALTDEEKAALLAGKGEQVALYYNDMMIIFELLALSL